MAFPLLPIGVLLVIIGVIGGVILFVPVLHNILDLAPYMFTNAKIRALEAGLLKKEKLEALVESKNMSECISSLEDTDYGEHLTKLVEPITHHKIDQALNQYLVEVNNKVVRTVPDNMKDAFKNLLKLWDVKNIKTVLRSVHTNLPIEEREQYIVPIGTLKETTLKTLTESKTMEEIISELDNTVYGPIITEAMPSFENEKSLLPIELSLDKFALTSIYKKLSTMKKDPNAGVVQSLIGTKIDIINLKTVMQGKIEEVSPEVLENYIIPVNYSLGEDAMKNIIRVGSIDEMVSYLDGTQYSEVMQEALTEYKSTNSISTIEKALDNYYTKTAKSLSLKYPLGIGPALNLMVAKEEDVKKLRTILKFKGETLIKAEELGALIA